MVDGSLLADFIRTSARGERRVAFIVTGGSGAGKSTVLRRFLSGCHANGISVEDSKGLGVGSEVVYGDYHSLDDQTWGCLPTSLPCRRCLVVDDLHMWMQERSLAGKSPDILEFWPGHIVAATRVVEMIPRSMADSFVVVEVPIVASVAWVARQIRAHHPQGSGLESAALAARTPKTITVAQVTEVLRHCDQRIASIDTATDRARCFRETFSNSIAGHSSNLATRDIPRLPPSLDRVRVRSELLISQHLARGLGGGDTGAVSRLSASTTGMLLSGATGTGKTLLTHALEAGFPAVPFLRAGSYEFFGKYLGESEEKLRDFFRNARSQAPCVVILEDIDVLAQKRSEGTEGSSVAKRILTALLCELDGVEDNSGVLVIGTTSAVHTIDGALLRQGRLETILSLSALDCGDVEALVSYNADILTRAGVSGEQIVAQISGSTLARYAQEMRHLLQSSL